MFSKIKLNLSMLVVVGMYSPITFLTKNIRQLNTIELFRAEAGD